MSQMMVARATLEQALEALRTPIHEQPLGMRQAAITALRAALAQDGPGGLDAQAQRAVAELQRLGYLVLRPGRSIANNSRRRKP